MKPTLRLFIAVTFIILYGISCRKAENTKPADTPGAVAFVAGTPIMADAVRDELRRRFGASGIHPTAAQRESALETLIQTEVLYARARANGFDRSPEVQARIKNLIVTQFKETQSPSSIPTVTDREVEEFYAANKSRYAIPAAVRGGVIRLEVPADATPEKQKEFHQYSQSVLAEAKAAANTWEFADVVRRYSTDQASRYRGGDTGWLTSKGAVADTDLVIALAAITNPGDFAPPIFTPRGLCIAKLLEKKDAGFRPLSEVRDSIRYQLARAKAQQVEAIFQASLKKGLDIQINQHLLESLTLPVEKSVPPKLPETRSAQLRQ